ncbi:MAG: PD-(D/E)XK nuclease family protein [Planctomycetota bacterium]
MLTSISAVSPSLAEVLRLCPLRGGLSRAEGAGRFVLGQPKAWLGTAYHAVLEGAAGGGAAAAHEAAWLAAINEQHDRARQHPLDQRFGQPERWPGYHLIRAMALLRAQEVGGPSSSTGRPGAAEGGRASREQWLSGAGGRLVGRPDLVRGNAVIDYKTGDIHEQGDSAAAKASYVRQLQIYAFLVKERTGRWPARGVLLPMEGPPLEVELEPLACERAAAEAVSLLDQYNREIEAGVAPTRLASPSTDACMWCPYQVLCPAFWAAAAESWSDQLGAAAIGGSAPAAPKPIHGGAALALSLRADEGTGPRGEVGLAPLNPGVHPSLAQVKAGTRVRVSGLARRADGTVVPSLRTVVARLEDLPGVVVAGTAIPNERGAGPAQQQHAADGASRRR